MNAPFNAGRPGGLRDPFTAFVCEDATAELLRPIAVEHGWSPEKVNKGGLRNAVQSLSVAASPSILFVDLSRKRRSAQRHQRAGRSLRARHGGDRRRPGQRRPPLSRSARQRHPGLSAEAVLGRSAARRLRQCADDALRPAHERDRERAAATSLAAVIGVRGGVGASTVASSLAWLMGDKAGRSTALLDLDVHFGTGALSLDLEPGRGLTDAIENPSRIDGLFIERAMVRANDKLCVLSAEAPINQPLLTDGSAFYQLQEEIRHAFEGTVIDLPRHMLVQHPHLVNDVQVGRRRRRVHARRDPRRDPRPVLAEGECAAGAGDRRRQQGAAERRRRSAARISSIRSSARSISQLPFDPKTATQAAKLGQPLRQDRPSRPRSRSRSRQLLDSDARRRARRAARRPPASTSLLGKLGGFKALVAKKPGAPRRPDATEPRVGRGERSAWFLDHADGGGPAGARSC